MEIFVLSQLPNIITVLLFIILCVALIKMGYTPYVRQMLFYLVMQAEAEFGKKTGELKYTMVTMWLYQRLPLLIRILFTPKQIDSMIEDAVDKLKEYIKNGGIVWLDNLK